MPDFLWGVLGIGGLLVVAWLINKATTGASRAVNRAVFSGRHREGQQHVTKTASFTSRGSVTDTVDAVLNSVNAYSEAPTVAPGLYLATREPNKLAFRFGSKLATSFEAAVLITEGHDDGCSGRIVVTKWTEVDGLVGYVDQMKRLTERITKAARDLVPAQRDGSNDVSGTTSGDSVPVAAASPEFASFPPPEGRGDHPSPGWYRDPQAGDHYRMRYWDGASWTERVD